MPINLDDIPDDDPEGSRSNAAGEEGGKWKLLFTTQPESGGPYKGRNNALSELVWFMYAKAFPFEGACTFAQHWNKTYCRPPLDPGEVADVVSRRWAEINSTGYGKIDDQEPDGPTVKREPWQFLSFAEMEVEEERVGKLAWLLPNVLPVGGLVYFSAPPAGAKTWLLLDLVRALSSGGRWIGKFDVPQTGVLYIDEEMGVRKALPRLRKLGVTAKNVGFWYTNKAGVRFDLAQDVVRILDHCKANEVGVVIVDTLTRVHRLDENDNSQMKSLFEKFSVLMQAGITVIVAHHDRKGGVGDSNVSHERMRGAGEIAASADMSFSVDKRSGYFRLETTKGRLAAEDDFITVDFVIEDDETKTTTVVRECRPEERSEKTLAGIEERVVSLLGKSGPLETQAIKDNVRGTDASIVATLKRLVEAGIVTETKGDRRTKIYSLATPYDEGGEDGD